MALVPVFPILARAFFGFLGLRSTFFNTAFLRLPLRQSILALRPPFLRLRSGAFLRLRLAMLNLALLVLLRPILRLVSFLLLRLDRLSILSLTRLIWLALPVLDLAFLRLPCLALLWLTRETFGLPTLS